MKGMTVKTLVDAQFKFQRNMQSSQPVMRMAAMAELGEWLQSLGFEDWKPSEKDVDNCQIELADFMIFIINCIFYGNEDFLENITIEPVNNDYQLMEKVIWLFTTKAYSAILMTIDAYDPAIKRIAFGKKVLNQFRQDNGYKEGTYKKYWAEGQEDNVYLTKLMRATPDELVSHENIYNSLESRYKAVLNS